MVEITGLAALFVSFVALVVAFTQVIQQYAATGYNSRRCSPRTMGGWALQTRLKFIWREVRFEVTFSTPKITIDQIIVSDSQYRPESFMPLDSQHNKGDRVLSIAEDCPTTAEYTIKLVSHEVSKDISRDGTEEAKWHIEQKPWFLRTDATVEEARRPWLNFMEDIAYTNLRITLVEQRKSYDFMPDALLRPIATVDGGAFLTIMSLFGIQWNNRGVDRKFTGISESGFGEISVTNVLNFGDVYEYRRSPRLGRSLGQSNADLKRTRFIIPSEKAKLAMFNCFDLDFATIRTHDSAELGDSLRKLHMSEQKVRSFMGYFDGDDGWVPGVRDAIACWAAASMLRMVALPEIVTSTTKPDEFRFKSVYSSRSAVPITTEPGIAAMLLGGNHDNIHYKTRFHQVESINKVTTWAKDYLETLPPSKAELVRNCLLWIASYSPAQGNVMPLDTTHVRYSLSEECFEGILALDQDLLNKDLPSQDQERARQIKLKFCLEQIQSQCNKDGDFDKASREEGQSWQMVADRVASGYYYALPSKIAHLFESDVVDNPSAQRRAQRMVVNRLMRATLWAVHNGNSPDLRHRSLQCSLSSNLLQQNFTIHLS